MTPKVAGHSVIWGTHSGQLIFVLMITFWWNATTDCPQISRSFSFSLDVVYSMCIVPAWCRGIDPQVLSWQIVPLRRRQHRSVYEAVPSTMAERTCPFRPTYSTLTTPKRCSAQWGSLRRRKSRGPDDRIKCCSCCQLRN